MRKAEKNYNKLMVLGTAAADENGELYLSDIGKRRCDRVAEAYFDAEFTRDVGSILVSGGYGKMLFENPPVNREAPLMADYLRGTYGIPIRHILTEDESTDTSENFNFSLHHFREFFAEIQAGEAKLGVVSHKDHLKKAAKLGRQAINCSDKQLIMVPVHELIIGNGRVASIGRSAVGQSVEVAADE